LLLKEQGIEKLPELISDLFMERRPGLIFIDSFKALNEILKSPEQRRSVIFEMATALSAYECTSFLIGEYADATMTDLPEFAIADVVLQLIKHTTNVREQRFVRVEKLRGSKAIPGLHAFSISTKGLQVFPRLLTPSEPPSYNVDPERVTTGIKGLDEMIEGGLISGSTTLVAGPPGSGKTIMGLEFLN